MNAPFCPVSRSQPTSPMAPVKLPAIPLATDLTSLIASINAMLTIVRSLTSSLTVNNTYLPRTPPPMPDRNTVNQLYPNWQQVSITTVPGFVYYKSSSGKDGEQRAYIQRSKAVEFRNTQANDAPFIWSYSRPLDSPNGDTGGLAAFNEDFFERIVNVHWSTSLAVEFTSGGS